MIVSRMGIRKQLWNIDSNLSLCVRDATVTPVEAGLSEKKWQIATYRDTC